MFIRFVSSQWDARARSCAGLFAPAYRLRQSSAAPGWQRAELARELDWFARHLEVPARLRLPVGHRGRLNGVCWFRDCAAEHVSHARYIAWLLDENGVPIEELRASHPGTIIWGDDHQVVALTDRAAPYCYH